MRSRSISASITAVTILGLMAWSAARAIDLGYAGRLTQEDGSALAGPVDVTLRFFGSPTDADQLGASLPFTGVTLSEGVFQLKLSMNETQQFAVFGDGSRSVYVEVEAAGKVYPRQVFQAVPVALRVPVDNDTLVFSSDSSKLTVARVDIDQVTGLAAALDEKLSAVPASSATSGYLAAADWTRFDAKQPPITPTTTLDAGSLATSQQGGLVVNPYGAATSQTGELRFAELSGGNYIGFKAPDALTSNRIWTLPGTDGANGDVLVTNGAGALAWTAPASGGAGLAPSQNLSDLTNASAARGNLGLGPLATMSAIGSAEITDGSVADADIAALAAIADTKLATIATPGKVSGAAITSGTIGGSAAFAGSSGVATSGAINGTGNFNINGTGAATTELRFGDVDNSNYVGFKGPDTVATNKVWTLPATDGGSGQFLSTNGSGVLSWGSPAGGGDIMASANLSDLSNVATARTNLGLGSLATMSAIGSADITDGQIADADISTTAAIATSKLSGSVTAISGHGLGTLATLNAVGAAEITDATIANADISGAAAIATSKLAGAVTSISGHGLGALATLNGVGAAEINAASVGNSELVDGSVTTQKIADGSIATIDLAADAVTGSEIADGSITNADVATAAAIATSKLSGAITSISGHGLGALATLSAVGSAQITDASVASADITDSTIVNADIAAAAAIATSKLSGALTAISGHGLGALATLSAVGATEITDASIADADISATAAIATSKLAGALTAVSGHGLGALATLSAVGSSQISDGTIVDADISGTAAISSTKISFVADSISGTAVDGGTISNFSSTGIDDNASSVAMTLTSAGNVGIGTTVPGQKLSVAGTVESTSGGFKFPDGTTQTTAASAGQWTTSGSDVYRSSGNVGIGTTNPASILEVASGTVKLGDILKLNKLSSPPACGATSVGSIYTDSNGSPYVCLERMIGGSNVNAIVRASNGDLYVGGGFSIMGGVANTGYIAKWNGTSWSALGSGVNSTVNDLALDSSGNLYAAGYFTTAGGTAVNYVAKWNGTTWSALDGGLSSWASTLAVDSAGNLYVGGNFGTAGSTNTTVSKITKWNGTSWSALGTGMNGNVPCLAVDGSDNLYAGGPFSSAGGVAVSNIAKWNGTTWSALGSGVGSYPSVLEFDAAGDLYAAGSFTSPGNYIAKWNGTAWSTLGSGLNGGVLAMYAGGAGNLYVGGNFTSAGTTPVGRLARWDGSSWTSPLSSSGSNGTINALLLASSTLYIGGGSITDFDGLSGRGVVSLETSTGEKRFLTQKAGTYFWRPLTVATE